MIKFDVISLPRQNDVKELKNLSNQKKFKTISKKQEKDFEAEIRESVMDMIKGL